MMIANPSKPQLAAAALELASKVEALVALFAAAPQPIEDGAWQGGRADDLF